MCPRSKPTLLRSGILEWLYHDRQIIVMNGFTSGGLGSQGTGVEINGLSAALATTQD
jgi:hypothetical protein